MNTKRLQKLAIVFAAVMCLLCFGAQGIFANEAPFTWSDFRGNAENNGVVNYKTPRTAEEAVLSWAFRAGTGWDNAASCPIIVNDTVIFSANRTLYKLDRVSGKVLATGTLKYKSDYNIIPPTYAAPDEYTGEHGMIFVGLSSGMIQAYDAETLETIWIYRDISSDIEPDLKDAKDSAIGGQVNCPLTYRDGYLYTGFWKGAQKDAYFVGIAVADEAKNKNSEGYQRSAWRYMNKGGFYWAGCYATDKYVVVGGDDGVGDDAALVDDPEGNAPLFCFDAKTGDVISSIPDFKGDIRSTVCFDDGYLYFTSKGKTFYRVGISEEGILDKSSVSALLLDGNSTSTPVVHNGRAYVGVMGTRGQFDSYSGHHVAVIDLEAWKIAYKCETKGYPQTSGLLTTAYEETDGYVYVYFFDNDKPGMLRVLKDKSGQTEPITNGETVNTLPVLFSPTDEHQQYAICSPICDEYGTIYFKNDSGYVMALTPNVEDLKFTAPPTKQTYLEGDAFDPTGAVAMLTYCNGLTRDVSQYLSCGSDTLNTDDIVVNVTFPYVMYQDNLLTPDEITAIDNDKTLSDSNKVIKKDENHVGVKVSVPYYELSVKVEPSAAVTDKMISEAKGTLTRERVKALRARYNSLNAEEKGKMKNLAILVEAEQKLANFYGDVKSEYWYCSAAEFVTLNGLMNGVDKGKFDGNGVTTRAQLVTILYRYAGSPDVSGSTPFTDVKAGQWYTDAVNWAYEKDVVKGVSATQFGTNEPVTREQLVTILYRYCKSQGMDVSGSQSLTGFSDFNRVSTYAETPMKWGVYAKLISGMPEGGNMYLRPQGSATRAQIATIMMRFIDPTAEEEGK